jgi:uncharacterized iron-regulated protein
MQLTQRFHVTFSMCAAVLLAASSTACLAADDHDRLILSHRQMCSFEQMIDALSKADVVVVGEQHDHKRGHALELEILQGIHARNPSLALSLEMFERDVQLVVDEYLTDQISQPSFLAASRPWPNYNTDYAPLVEFCKANKLPVIAANAPRRYVNVASRKGQKALLELPRESRAYLARLPYSMDLPPEYDRALTEVFRSHGAAGTGQAGAPSAMPPPPPYMKEGQALWDATMADSILKGRKTYPKRLILQMNGAMHSDSGYGLVDRLRKAAPKLKVMIVSIQPDAAYPNVDAGKYEKVADFVIVTGMKD